MRNASFLRIDTLNRQALANQYGKVQRRYGILSSPVFALHPLEMALRMLMAFTYLPGFVTLVFRGMPIVWRGRHRLLFCWLAFMQAVHPGRHTLEEMAR